MLESVTPAASANGPVGDLRDAQAFAANARPLAQAVLALARLVEAAPQLQHLLDALERRRKDLETGMAEAELAAVAKRKETDIAIEAEARRLADHETQVAERKRRIADELVAARAAADQTKRDLAHSVDLAKREAETARATLTHDRAAATQAHAAALAQMQTDLLALAAKRDDVRAEIERLRARLG